MNKKSKVYVRRGLGVFLIVFGLLSAFNVVSPYRLLATVTYPKYFWYQLYPDGVDASNPTLLSEGKSITVNVKLVYYDATANVELPSPTYWVVKVTIRRTSDNVVVKTIDFGRFDDVQGGVKIDSNWCSIAIWEESWTVPAGLGVTYKFEWSAQVKDSSGNDYGTQTKTTYGKTADIEPDGIFKINGRDASQTSSPMVLDPALSLEFVPSKNADKVTAVKVESWKGGILQSTVSLTKQTDGTYAGTYTLPGYGVYEIKGFIEWTGGNPLRKMSLIASWGEEGQFGFNQIIGIVSMAIGIFLAAKK